MESETKVSPEVFQAALLDEIATNLKSLKDLLASTIPEGILETFEVTVTDVVQELRPARPWFSVNSVNKGPHTVYIGVNVGRVNAQKVSRYESFPVDMKAAKIKFINYHCDSGESATVHIIAVR